VNFPHGESPNSDPREQFPACRNRRQYEVVDQAAAIGHFELVEQMGIGTLGSVWRARDVDLDRTVAVKIPC
jgi:hypothetical protein